ncbi:MAG: hypothetical protein HWN66_18595 [Candidatus Helarchaeota archaeon]|nr:hypothetical protein [Candidatus Helarchaeota archaeon]
MAGKEKTIFEEIKEKIEDIIMGRRYLITEMGKLKIGMDKIVESLPNVADLTSWLDEVKSAVSNLGQLTGLIDQLQTSSSQLTRITSAVEEIRTTFSGITDLRAVSDQITLAATKITKLGDSVREVRDSIRGLADLQEGFEAALATMGELKIAMSSLGDTMTTLTSSFEGLAGIADLSNAAKTMKPAIDELRETLSGLGALRNTLADLSRQTASIGDLKVLTSELNVAMREIRSSVQGLRPGVAQAASAPAASTAPSGQPLPSQVASRAVTQAKAKTAVYKAGRTTRSKAPSATPIGTTPSTKSTGLRATKRGAGGKKGKTPPIVTEVLGLLTERAQGGADGHALAKIMENARDTISKSWRWHPALYELGTFARKLRKLPKGQEPDGNLLNTLMQKINEWLEKMVD